MKNKDEMNFKLNDRGREIIDRAKCIFCIERKSEIETECKTVSIKSIQNALNPFGS